MNMITAMAEIFTDPLAGGFVGGWIFIGLGVLLGSGTLFVLGGIALVLSLLAGMVLALR
ncbi:hypothetical protein M199_gp181 [Halogranum tailed virus 1]|uniref:Uncharacterized protein n=1 Tax=Halogranum tailed virus 1 TaxID=1273749 RepID=R4T999_9CAUD|nr:hypothetical protein M199_gp181 [Halogranum tailed virus 1]AGM11485.1 hypothetical protein HGTV1_188 [Halogranum tailed virus 1]